MRVSVLSTLVSLAVLAGCANDATEPVTTAEDSARVEAKTPVPVEATSFLGEPLLQKEATPERAQAADDALAKLTSDVELSEDDYIQMGLTIAAAGRYKDAIIAYSQGIEENPDSYKLRRYRAHRYITTRQLEKAREDLEQAGALVTAQGASSVLELKAGKPHGTYAHWINYHLGLYYYLGQDFESAAALFERCVESASDNDMLIGSVDWLYNSYLRSGKPEAADAVLDLVASDIVADETYPYYKRVMIYKGVLAQEDVIDLYTPGTWNGRDATVAYALASGMIASGHTAEAEDILSNILDTSYWPIWAYVTAEADYAALTDAPTQD